MVQISKKDTLDIADSIARNIWCAYKGVKAQQTYDHIWIRDIIEEGLNDWISECETETAEAKQKELENTPGTGEMFDGDY